MADLLVLGTGLIGTSLGLALRGVRDVMLTDPDPDALRVAVGRGAGRAWRQGEPAGLVVACVPLPAVPAALLAASQVLPRAVLTHVGSAQVHALAEAGRAGVDLSRLCGGHPMAGREQSGPGAGAADLFAGRPWFLCPGPTTSPEALDAVRALALDVGAEPVLTTPAAHDRTVALVSHLPQVVSSALAARLLAGAQTDAERAGPGLVDTTRLAASPPALWHDVLAANAAEVVPLLRALAEDLRAVADDLASPGELAATDDLLRRGNAGRARVPVKRGRHDRDLVAVLVELPDRPAQLAAVLVAAGEAGVNVEDLRLDHVPGRPQGTLELLVAQDGRAPLLTALRQRGLVADGA